MKVLAGDGLRTVAFKVCSVLQEADVIAVLTGGSAATVYAPDAYQSKDLDFVLQFNVGTSPNAERALDQLGYVPDSGQYVHRTNPLTVDFLSHPIAIGQDIINHWDTLTEAEMILHILSPTDCCRDRLAHFLHWNDRAALAQAVAVAKNEKVDLAAVRSWCKREGHLRRFLEFEKALGAKEG